MNRLTTRLFAISFAALAATACGKKQESAPAPTASGSAAAGDTAAGSAEPTIQGSAEPAGSAAAAVAAVAAVEPAAADEAVDVPTEMDFEDDATGRISEANLEDAVKALEAELGES
ncbi:MAG: hypothetical protein ACTHU0_28055 [Kofleriaceae bacterium]